MDINQFIEYGVGSMQKLVVNGKVKAVGTFRRGRE
jgi:hypothetical protein